jgi:hypothetical protein
MEEQVNIELRLYARRKRVPLWRIAKDYDVTELTLYRWLRKPFSQQCADDFMRAVDKIANGE